MSCDGGMISWSVPLQPVNRGRGTPFSLITRRELRIGQLAQFVCWIILDASSRLLWASETVTASVEAHDSDCLASAAVSASRNAPVLVHNMTAATS